MSPSNSLWSFQAPPDDEQVAELLRTYHHKKIMSRKLIQTMLLAEGIIMRFVLFFQPYDSQSVKLLFLCQ